MRGVEKYTFNSYRSCIPLTYSPPVSPVAIHIYPLRGYFDFLFDKKIVEKKTGNLFESSPYVLIRVHDRVQNHDSGLI